MADRNHVLLMLALGADTAKRVEQMKPASSPKERAIVREAHQKGNVNRPGRS